MKETNPGQLEIRHRQKKINRRRRISTTAEDGLGGRRGVAAERWKKKAPSDLGDPAGIVCCFLFFVGEGGGLLNCDEKVFGRNQQKSAEEKAAF
jgi:hypothetical protein